MINTIKRKSHVIILLFLLPVNLLGQLPYINNFYSEKLFGEVGMVVAYADSFYYLSGIHGENQTIDQGVFFYKLNHNGVIEKSNFVFRNHYCPVKVENYFLPL